jgi:hypothetical protein
VVFADFIAAMVSLGAMEFMLANQLSIRAGNPLFL